MKMSMTTSLLVGFFVRIVFLIFGMWQDSTMAVKYTDVDYYVFTDAARFVTKGLSPYQRATYRYTPLLAWILTPNITVSLLYGKLLFILGDIVASLLIYQILLTRGFKRDISVICSYIWLFNPLTIAVSTRGNAESIMAVLVLSTIYFLIQRKTYALLLSAALYGLAVHMKIYPVTYSLPIYLFLNYDYSCHKKQTKMQKYLMLGMDIVPSKTRMAFITIGVIILFGLTLLFWNMYGNEFLQETYFYHITRKDIRHNFSPYFYMMYLTSNSNMVSLLSMAAFIPQAILLLLASVLYYKDLPFCCFVQTFLFVTFNKVCTSQYFLWYVCLLPLIIPQMRISLKESVALTAAWFCGQALWLCPAYYLEFEGRNSFLYIWMAGLVFFAVNIGILCRIIAAYNYNPIFKNGKLSSVHCQVTVPGCIKKYIDE